jgi:drug/metabolite transporter (DMT)-like permease
MTPRKLVLLVFLTLFWGINWPIMKYATGEMPPLLFRAISMAGGIAVIFAYAAWMRFPLRVPRGELATLLRLALPNMVVWHLFAISGVALLSSGRAAIIGYTMPTWVALFGLTLRGHRPDRRQALGIVCAALAVLLLLSGEFGAIAGSPLGALMMLIAAAGWGYGTVLLRETRLTLHATVLTAWMLCFALAVMIAAAWLLEGPRWRWPSMGAWWAIAFNAVLVFGYCHVAWTLLARSLPPLAAGLSVMFIPVVGVFSGAWWLGETLHWQDWAAVVLVVLAVAGALLPRRQTG